MRMRKKKWVSPFLNNEVDYIIGDLLSKKINMPIYVEIGMGMGDFICESAKSNPDVLYIGLEKVDVCVARAIKKAKDYNLNNFKVILANADSIDVIIPPKYIDIIYLHFSDPWPKKRQHKRRLTYHTFLSKYEKILKSGGYLIFKTDNVDFFNDSLSYFSNSNFINVELSNNYINNNEPVTAYQARFMAEGKPIFYAKYVLK